jgi:hypothetical protein
MNFEEFQTYYWKYFCKYVCSEYYLSWNFIEQYKYEVEWSGLSRNKSLLWNKEKIIKYKDKWIKQFLLKNPAVDWSTSMIKAYGKRVDWYYLSQNPGIDLEELLGKFKKKINWHFIIYHPDWTEEHEKKYHEFFSSVKLKSLQDKELLVKDLFEKKSDYCGINPKRLVKSLTVEEIYSIIPYISWDEFDKNSVMLKILFSTEFDPQTIENLFKKRFERGQYYYFCGPQKHDDYGLTPELKLEYKHSLNTPEERNTFLDTHTIQELHFGKSKQGPKRVYDVMRIYMIATGLLVSEEVKEILEKFKLPEHRWYPTKLVDPKIFSKTFYILHLVEDSLERDLDYSKTEFIVDKGIIDKFFKEKLGTFKNKEERDKKQKELTMEDYFARIRAENYSLVTDMDIYTYSRKIIINEFVKKALEVAGINGVSFTSSSQLNITINNNVYKKRKKKLDI